MTLDLVKPLRPLEWPEIIYKLQAVSDDIDDLFLVGGVVRDALRGTPVHDIDIASASSGLEIARLLANQLGGSYYPVDPQRQTGRIILDDGVNIDIASFRGADLEADLRGRDFTINAIAVPLSQPDALYDPLDGQQHLLVHKILKMCSTDSIISDPIRSLRAVRMGLQFGLRLLPETTRAVREGATYLTEHDDLMQPERIRDELFKGLQKTNAASLLRLYQAVGIYEQIAPDSTSLTAEDLRLITRFCEILTIISPRRDDNIANELFLGVAVMVLDRYRADLQDYLTQVVTDERTVEALLVLAGVGWLQQTNAEQWAAKLKLSNVEKRLLHAFQQVQLFQFDVSEDITDRALFLYYQRAKDMGVGGILFKLAEYLNVEAPDPETWGSLLEEVGDPVIRAYFQRHGEIVEPVPIIDGNDLMAVLGLTPGKQLGQILKAILEEQAAGSIQTREEAFALAARLAET